MVEENLIEFKSKFRKDIEAVVDLLQTAMRTSWDVKASSTPLFLTLEVIIDLLLSCKEVSRIFEQTNKEVRETQEPDSLGNLKMIKVKVTDDYLPFVPSGFTSWMMAITKLLIQMKSTLKKSMKDISSVQIIDDQIIMFELAFESYLRSLDTEKDSLSQKREEIRAELNTAKNIHKDALAARNLQREAVALNCKGLSQKEIDKAKHTLRDSVKKQIFFQLRQKTKQKKINQLYRSQKKQ